MGARLIHGYVQAVVDLVAYLMVKNPRVLGRVS